MVQNSVGEKNRKWSPRAKPAVALPSLSPANAAAPFHPQPYRKVARGQPQPELSGFGGGVECRWTVQLSPLGCIFRGCFQAQHCLCDLHFTSALTCSQQLLKVSPSPPSLQMSK